MAGDSSKNASVWPHCGSSTNLEESMLAGPLASCLVCRTEGARATTTSTGLSRETAQCHLGRWFLCSESPSPQYLSLEGIQCHPNLELTTALRDSSLSPFTK